MPVFDNDYLYDILLSRRNADGGDTRERYSTETYTSLPRGPGFELEDFTFAGFYDGRVKNPGLLDVDLWGRSRTRGGREVATGVCQFLNTDGALDTWMLSAFDGGNYSVYFAPRKDRDNRTLVFQGSIEQEPVIDEKQATLNVRDLVYSLHNPVLTKQYAGNNALPMGVEGSANDIKGKLKPLLMGVVRNVSPPCVNTSVPIYQLSCRPFVGAWSVTVFVNRVQLLQGADLTDGVPSDAGSMKLPPEVRVARWNTLVVGPSGEQVYATYSGATLIPHGRQDGDIVTLLPSGGAAFPAPLNSTQYYYIRTFDANHFRLYNTRNDAMTGFNPLLFDTTTANKNNNFELWFNKTMRGRFDWANEPNDAGLLGFFIRTGTDTTAQQVTCDVTAPYFGHSFFAQPQMNGLKPHELLQELLNWATDGGLNKVYADLAQYPDVGIWIDDARSYLEAANFLVQGVSAGFYFEREMVLPKVRMKQLKDSTSVSPVAYFDQSDILSIKSIVSSDDDRGIPAWRVNVKYKRNHTVQGPSDLPGIALADIGFTTEEFRQVSVQNDATKVQWPVSPEVTIESNIDNVVDATNEATRLLNLYKIRRRMFEVEVPLAIGNSVQPGDVVNIKYPRFNLSAGKNFQAIGMRYNLHNGPVVTLTVWG